LSRRLGFLILLAITPVLGQAQLKVHLDFGSTGPREVWVAPQLPKAPPSTVFKTEGATYDLTVPGFGTGDKLFVWDKTTGNIAAKPMEEASKGWSVKPEDYKLVGTVKVRVEHKGLPVAAAGVSVKDKGGERSEQLDPSAKGEIQVFGVQPGELKVSVTYRSQGKMADPMKQSFDVPLKRAKPEPMFVVSIPDEVETIDPAAAEKQTPDTGAPATGNAAPATGAGAATPPAEQANPLGSILIFLLAAALIVGGGYYGLMYIKNNSKQVQDKLEQLGVQVPKPIDDQALAAPVVPVPKAPEPPQKIMLDDAAPDLIGAAATSTAVAPVVTGVPRLVMDNGDEFAVPEGDTSVGREVGLGLSLVGESTVSRNHAVVTRSGGTVTVKDLGSTNGTYVNGMKVSGQADLRPGDTVQFGSVRFRYEG
jgi:hypothetical protein